MGIRKNSKGGVTLVFLGMSLVLMMIILWVSLNIEFLKTNVVEKDIEVRSEIHTMGNALDAAKLYMETALAYSTYQACYDNLRNGGMDSSAKTYKGYPLWDSTPPGKEGFDQALQRSILSNMELYRKSSYKFMSEYFVNIPTYEVAVLTEQPGKTSVGAWNSSNFWIEKSQENGERIRLEKYGFLQGEYPMVCYGIYAKGLETYSLAQAAMEKAWSETQAPKTVPTGSDIDSQLSVYNKTFIDKAKSGLYALSTPSNAQSDYDVGVDVRDANLKWTSVIIESDKTTVAYTQEVYVKFEITNIKSGQEFPVYDGSKVIMSHMTLVFVQKFGPADILKEASYMRVASSSIVSYDGSNAEIERYQCPPYDANCEITAGNLRAEGWTVYTESGIIPVGYKKPVVPVPGTANLQKIAEDYAQMRGIEKQLVFGVIHKESTWNPNAISPAGAMGLMQLIPGTAREFGWKESEGSLLNPEISVKYGTLYFKWLLDKFEDTDIALAAYNTGHNRVEGLLRKACPTYPACQTQTCPSCPTFETIRKRLPLATVVFVSDVNEYSRLYAAYIASTAAQV